MSAGKVAPPQNLRQNSDLVQFLPRDAAGDNDLHPHANGCLSPERFRAGGSDELIGSAVVSNPDRLSVGDAEVDAEQGAGIPPPQLP